MPVDVFGTVDHQVAGLLWAIRAGGLIWLIVWVVFGIWDRISD